VVLELGRGGGWWGELGEAAGGVEGSGFDEVGAGVEEEAWEVVGAGPGFGGGEEGSASAAAAVLGGDVEAGELAGGVDAEVTGGDAVGAQDEEDAEALGGELLQAEVDLGLVGLAVEVADRELGEVLADQRMDVGGFGGFGADGPDGGVRVRSRT